MTFYSCSFRRLYRLGYGLQNLVNIFDVKGNGYSSWIFAWLNSVVTLIILGIFGLMIFVRNNIMALTIFFDRFIACFRIQGNVGFFIVLIDFIGYTGTVIVLTIKEFFHPDINWLQFYNQLLFHTSKRKRLSNRFSSNEYYFSKSG